MNFAFDIVLYQRGRHTSLYTFKDHERDESELDAFLSDPDVRANPDFRPLAARLKKGLKRGFSRSWFRDEGAVKALSAPYPKEAKAALETPFPPALRLYCVRRMDIVLCGYGGIKTERTYQEQDELESAVNELAYVDRRLADRLDQGIVWFIDDKTLGGDLTFPTRRYRP